MRESEIVELRAAVEKLHGYSATFREAVAASDTHQGQLVWSRDVAVFDLRGHAKAKVCYAWSEVVTGSDRQRFFAVLKAGPVQSGRDAVLASIASDVRWDWSTAREGERIALEVAALKAAGRFEDAVALVETYDLASVAPEVRISVLVQGFYAAHEGHLEAKAHALAARIAKEEPDLPSIQQYLSGK